MALSTRNITLIFMNKLDDATISIQTTAVPPYDPFVLHVHTHEIALPEDQILFTADPCCLVDTCTSLNIPDVTCTHGYYSAVCTYTVIRQQHATKNVIQISYSDKWQWYIYNYVDEWLDRKHYSLEIHKQKLIMLIYQ